MCGRVYPQPCAQGLRARLPTEAAPPTRRLPRRPSSTTSWPGRAEFDHQRASARRAVTATGAQQGWAPTRLPQQHASISTLVPTVTRATVETSTAVSTRCQHDDDRHDHHSHQMPTPSADRQHHCCRGRSSASLDRCHRRQYQLSAPPPPVRFTAVSSTIVSVSTARPAPATSVPPRTITASNRSASQVSLSSFHFIVLDVQVFRQQAVSMPTSDLGEQRTVQTNLQLKM